MQDYSFEIIDKSLDEILCIKLTSKSTDYSLLLLICYLPPENSVWGRNSQQFLSHVLSYIYINNECASVFVCGDFNARIGSLDDLTYFDDVNIIKRHVLDKPINQHGHSFIDILNEAKLCILNSRFNETENNFTSVSTPGKAVVDYICVPHDVMKNTVSFKVRTARSIIEDGNLSGLLGERSKAPDDSVLIAEFQTSHICTDNYDAHNEEASDRKRYKL